MKRYLGNSNPLERTTGGKEQLLEMDTKALEFAGVHTPQGTDV